MGLNAEENLRNRGRRKGPAAVFFEYSIRRQL